MLTIKQCAHVKCRHTINQNISDQWTGHTYNKNMQCEFGTDGNLFLHNNKTSNFRMDEFKCVYIYQECFGEKKNSTYWKYCKKIYIYLSILCRTRTQNAIKALFMSSIIIMHGAEFYLPLVYIGDILKYKNCVFDFDWMSFNTFPVFFNKFTKKMSLWKNTIIWKYMGITFISNYAIWLNSLYLLSFCKFLIISKLNSCYATCRTNAF